ncbi:jg6208 [Pararge aegeria aegeria]|uniref:Jg6208 protein n=1 Tax=Pararge aegeria aegeria TaxID=348720 RepID=A0A8S4RM83_9NEOP|nr:jg6208 [Pararge aegeria aegeria]
MYPAAYYLSDSRSHEAKVKIGGVHSSKNRWTWGPMVLEMRPHTGHRSVGRPPDEIINRVAESRWTQAAQDPGILNSL